MPEKRKVCQYTPHKKGFEFYGKEFMFVIFMKRIFYSTIECWILVLKKNLFLLCN